MTTQVMTSCLCAGAHHEKAHAHVHTHTHVCACAHTHSLQHKPPRGREEADTHTKLLHADTQGPKPRLRPVTQEGLGGALKLDGCLNAYGDVPGEAWRGVGGGKA